MRKQTLSGLCFLLAIAVVYALREMARAQGIDLPWTASYTSVFIASFIVAPLLMIPAAKLNQRLLAWRKARGRDIEAEERHEIVGADIISLRPVRSEDEGTNQRP
jgi:hypothetical protein